MVSYRYKNLCNYSVVGVLDNPSLKSELSIDSLHSVSEPDLSQLVVEEDAGIEGEGWSDEVWEWNLSGSEGNVQLWGVAEDGNKSGLEEESEVSEVVDHALLGEGEVSGLADHQVSPLDADDGAEITGLSELEGLSGVADWPVVAGVGVSVEVWIVVVIWIPSALGVVGWVSEVGVEESNINLGVDCLV